MKKIVLLSDGRNFSKNTFSFITSLYANEPILLVGAFFHSINYEVLISTTFSRSAKPYLNFLDEEKTTFKRGMQRFSTLCEQNNIDYRIHEESDEWYIDDLVRESRFADIIAVSSELFFADVDSVQPNKFLRDVLTGAECPVLVVPENVERINRIAIAYDGKKESVYAIKMFCYLFPNLTNLPADVYHWVEHTGDEMPDKEFLQEFAGRHFSDLNFCERFFNPSEYLSDWLENNKDTMLICGSYHRSKVSTFFKKSFVEGVIKNHSAAAFIAHS